MLVLEQILNRNSGISRHSGFLARTLITNPESRMGERYYQEPSTSIDSLNIMEQRLTECLNTSLVLDNSGCDNIPILTFSNSAKNVWTNFFNKVEEGLAESHRWQSIKDFASKAAENVARLAALFHLFDGKDGSIEVETIEKAIQIIEWHLWETRRILQVKPQSTQQQDATRLIEWLIYKNLLQTTPRQIQQFGPLRNKQRRDRTIQYLVETNYLRETKLDGKTTLLVNPDIIKNK